MNDRLVSIIVPVYNAESYISKTIEMVFSQTYSDWELILVNDGSADSSIRVICRYLESGSYAHSDGGINDDLMVEKNVEDQQFYQKITYNIGKTSVIIASKKKNEGAAKARNTGLDLARGRYIAFLDADDVWKPDKLEKEMAFLKEKNAGFVFTAYEFGDEKAVPTGKTCRVPMTLSYKEALCRTIIFTSTVLIDTGIVDKSLIYMPQVKSEDTATWWKILKSGIPAYGLDIPLVIYRRPGKSLSSNKGEAIRRIWKLYRDVEGLSLFYSVILFIRWAFRATYRRVVPDRNIKN